MSVELVANDIRLVDTILEEESLLFKLWLDLYLVLTAGVNLHVLASSLRCFVILIITISIDIVEGVLLVAHEMDDECLEDLLGFGVADLNPSTCRESLIATLSELGSASHELLTFLFLHSTAVYDEDPLVHLEVLYVKRTEQLYQFDSLDSQGGLVLVHVG